MFEWVKEGGYGSRAAGILKTTFEEFGEDDCMTMAASLAYYTIFSLPPLLVVTVAITASIVGRQVVEAQIVEQAHALAGPAAAEQIQTMLASAGDQLAARGWMFAASLAVLLFASTGVLVQLQVALNRAWEVRPDPESGGLKNFLAKRLISLGLLLAVTFLFLVSLVLSAAVSAFGGVLFGLLPNQISEHALAAIDAGASVVLFTFVFAAIFHYLPDAKVGWREVWIGGFVTAVLFAAGKFLLGRYLGTGNVGSYFGAAGSLAVILLWVYWVSIVLLLGAEFTQAWARAHGRPVVPEKGAVRIRRVPRSELERLERPQ